MADKVSLSDKMPEDDNIPHESTALAPTARAELAALDKRAEEAADDAVPENTRRAYELDLHCFASWCSRHGVTAMPADPKVIRAHLFELADRGRDPLDVPSGKPKGPMGYSAITRVLSAICRSHRRSGHPSPWDEPVIIEARDTLARLKGTAPKKQKRELGATGEALLFRVCDLISDDVRGIRDRAMLLIGWQGGGRRRSEIVAAQVADFQPLDGGLRWVIPRAKADQTGKGHVVALTPASDERYCPVRSLRRWLAVSKIERGPVFRGVDMVTGAVMTAPLAPKGVARRVQFYVKQLGLDPSEFGGHSLRSGFITSAYKMGRKVPDIMEASGHHNPREVLTYIRRAGLVEESAGRGLIDEAIARRPDPSPPPAPPPPPPKETPIPQPAPQATPTPAADDDFLARFTRGFR